ncbi:type IX secretion system sortase PorU [bacterium]|nr:type IX secretion system sortase PorU [bacterium]
MEMMLSSRFIIACLGLLIIASTALARVELLESNDRGCSFRYIVEAPSTQTQDSVNSDGQILIWPDVGMNTTDRFVQPVRVLFIALPQGTSPLLSVQSMKSEPAGFGLQGRPPEIRADKESPDEIGAKITGRQDWRGFQLARIEIVLQSGNAVNSTILSEIQVNIRFSGEAAAPASYERETKTLPSFAVNGINAVLWWKLQRPLRSLDEQIESWPVFDLYKLAVTTQGVYELSANWLLSNGIDLTGQPVAGIKMFGNGGRLLKKLPSQEVDQGLKEISVLIEDENSNGIFEQNDRILFYGEGLKGFDYANDSYLANWAHQSPFSVENVYWLGLEQGASDGLRMNSLATALGGMPQSTTTGRVYYDNDVFIYDSYFQSQSETGLIWYATTIDPGQFRTLSLQCEDATGGPGKIKVRTRAQQSAYNIEVKIGENSVIPFGNSEVVQAEIPAGILNSGFNAVQIINNSTSRWNHLNYIELEFERRVSAPSGFVELLAPDAASGFFAYTVEDLGSDGYLFDITDPLHPLVRRGNSFADSSNASQRGRYIALRSDKIDKPVFRGVNRIDESLDYRRLRDPSLEAGIIIITYDDWYDALEPMIDFHRNYKEEPLSAVRVKVGDIFDEFGWGNYDPVAIRNFLKYAYENWRGPSGSAEPPSYVLLVGGGDYDYRNLISSADQNWIPPWNELEVCTDDFYVDFNDSGNDLLDMMSGRWPVQTESEVEAIVNKTIQYAITPLYGPWKNTATFVADDEWKNGYCSEFLHTTESESLINQILPDYFTFRKLYEILYPFRTSATTSRKPDATQDLIETINRGTLLVNYKGHGSEHVWTDEQLFVMDRDYALLDNPRLWPLFVAATCTWGGYDRPNTRCFPELLLAHPTNGAVACIAASRFTFVSQNQELSREFYEELFRPGLETRSSLGHALRTVKPLKDRNSLYHVFGNPVLRLATPEFFAYVSEHDDSLQALSLYNLSGYVSKDAEVQVISVASNDRKTLSLDDPQVWSDFQGVVEARVFDSEDSAAYYWCGDTDRAPYYYGLPGNAIFRGLASVVNGSFNVTFRVPRDIQYGGSNAKVSLYFYGKSDSEPDSSDGIGILRPLRIASAAASEVDSLPPEISIWLEAPSFSSGDQVSQTPLLHVGLIDDSGINLSGAVGHRVTARIDDATTEDLTPFFNYNLDSYTDGFLEKEIGPLSIGEHRLVIEAWDSFNNLNQASATFLVGSEGEEGFAIHDVYNWPNPMSNETFFTYALTQSGTSDVSIKIYTLTGKLIDEIRGLGTRQLYNSNADRPWHGRDREGHELANGVYLYKVKAVHSQGHSAEATGKLVILR